MVSIGYPYSVFLNGEAAYYSSRLGALRGQTIDFVVYLHVFKGRP